MITGDAHTFRQTEMKSMNGVNISINGIGTIICLMDIVDDYQYQVVFNAVIDETGYRAVADEIGDSDDDDTDWYQDILEVTSASDLVNGELEALRWIADQWTIAKQKFFADYGGHNVHAPIISPSA